MAKRSNENMQFIEIIKEYPCIWNILHKDNSNVVKRNNAWNNVCRECDMTSQPILYPAQPITLLTS